MHWNLLNSCTTLRALSLQTFHLQTSVQSHRNLFVSGKYSQNCQQIQIQIIEVVLELISVKWLIQWTCAWHVNLLRYEVVSDFSRRWVVGREQRQRTQQVGRSPVASWQWPVIWWPTGFNLSPLYVNYTLGQHWAWVLAGVAGKLWFTRTYAWKAWWNGIHCVRSHGERFCQIHVFVWPCKRTGIFDILHQLWDMEFKVCVHND